MTDMTPSDIKRLLDEATPGPWEMWIDDTGGEFTGWPSVDAPEDIDATVVHRAGFHQEYWGDLSKRECLANAALIAAAPDIARAYMEQCEVIARLTAERDAIAARDTRATGWQPIATAPRDGTRMLVVDTDISVAWWEPNLEIIKVGDPDYKKKWERNYEIHYRGGWTNGVVESFAYETTQKLTPTHWQPLPAPPDAGQ